MYLKRLELLGFKSFADKVEITFEPGVTAVVGPNGCGKSNIADALRWVLGEQSLRALRGGKMEDVIFAGSDARKPLGLAEVELVLDNSDGYLPVDFAEVSVARRLYRSGESEFLINKAQVRLRDIQEMFLDTGLGKEAYSVIGQGKIDAILSVRAEERRAIFEEAAGVVKYKLRKAAAMRRLEETEANLVRVMDLLVELESQLGPLQSQAVLAEQSQRLCAGLAHLEINLVGHELAALLEAIGKVEASLEGVHARDTSVAAEEVILEANLEKLQLAAVARDEEVSRCQQELYNLGNRTGQERGQLELVRERMRAQEQRLTGLSTRRGELEERRTQHEARREEQEQALLDLGNVRREIAASLADSEGGIAASDGVLQGLARREEELKSEIIEDMSRVAIAKNGLQAGEMERDFLARSRHELTARSDTLEAEETAGAERLAKTQREHDELLSDSAQAAAEESGAAEKRRSIQESLTGVEAKNQEWRERIKGIESRLGLLEEMEDTYQGYFPGVRSVVVEAKRESFARGIKGLVAELIVVKPGYEVALEAALGSALQFVVIEDDTQAQAAIAYLKGSGCGRATFLPLNMVRGSRASAPGLAEAMSNCGAYLATDLVDHAPEYRGAIDHLLGNTLVAPSLAQAVVLAKKTGKAYRIVTKDGEIIGIGGPMTGGVLDRRKVRILGRKREIDDLRRDKDTALSFLGKGTAELERLRKEVAGVEAALAELAESRRDLARALAAAGKTVESLQSDRARLADELELLRFQLAENGGQASSLAAKEEQHRAHLAAAEESLTAHRRELDALGDELRLRKNEKDSAFLTMSDLRVALATRTEEEKKHRESLAETAQALAGLDGDLEKVAEEVKEIASSLAAFQEEEGLCGAAIARSEMETAAAEAALAGCVATRAQDQQEQRKTEIRLRALRRERQGLAEQVHRLELSLGEWRVRSETHRAHLLEEYGSQWETRLEAGWDLDRDEASVRIESLRAEIRALGPVNPGAIAEYEALRNRYEFLRRQYDDLTQAKESLQRIIVEVERTISQRFLETFDAVRAAFNVLFRRLFDGGKADLLLLDPDHPLEAGIEIVAQPPGKRLQSLSLLSGGERAMTAIALLFAILEVKPSPFCILDEIDSTLDDANVMRFADLLTRFSQRMQLIVVTHRRGTMEMADALYGVTMEEMGISKLISMQLKEKAG